MNKQFKNFMPESAIQLCIDLYETCLHGDPRTRKDVCSKSFTRLCRLAKRRHVRILWSGNDSVCQPDKFTFVKDGKEYLCNIDGIRYDGVNATCACNGRYFE